MPEAIKSSTTDRNGNVFLLVALNPNFWAIKSAAKLTDNGTTHKVVAVGQERYVRKQWSEFVANEKRQIASNYDALAQFSIRQNSKRA